MLAARHGFTISTSNTLEFVMSVYDCKVAVTVVGIGPAVTWFKSEVPTTSVSVFFCI